MKKKAVKTAKKMGRPPYIPNDEDKDKVRILVIVGTPIKTICQILGIANRVLYRHYKKEIQLAAQEATAQVAANLFRMTKKNPAAAMFWMKCKAGWREKDDSNAVTAPITINLKRGEERVSAKATKKPKDSNGTSG